MKKFCATFAFLIFAAAAIAQESPELEFASQPLAQGVPEVAIVRLQDLLGRTLPAEIRRTATAKLSEAFVAANEPEQALKLLEDPQLAVIPAAQFQHAQALAQLGRWADALPLYQSVANGNPPLRADALMGEGEALRALGRDDKAQQIYAQLSTSSRWKTNAGLRSVELLLKKNHLNAASRLLTQLNARTTAERKEIRFFRAQIEAKAGRRERALELFRTITDRPVGAERSVVIAALCAIADTHLAMKTPGAGGDAIEDFIDHHPSDSDLPKLFAKLDELYSAERRKSRHELGRWAADSAQPRRAFSQWYLARAELRLGQRDAALEKFAALRADHPRHPALANAFLEFAGLLSDDHRYDEAVRILETARELQPSAALLTQIDSLEGRAQYLAKNYPSAAEIFERLARRSPANSGTGFYNAALSWMQAKEPAHFANDSQALASTGNPEARGDLALEQGLVQASNGDNNAATTLQNFLRNFPAHPRRSEAWVALAELAFHAAPPRLDEARDDLKHANENQPTAIAVERADYLMLWIEDAAPKADDEQVIARANEFLRKREGSSFAPEVRLKLAEAFYRRQDFPSAQTQFEILARANPDAPLAEKALFFAAESAMQSMGAQSLDRALTMLDEVVKRGGEMKWPARNEQAVIERKLGKAQEALTLYDEVLNGDARPEVKREARCGKGDVSYELGASEPENYRRAIASYNEVANEQNPGEHWRNQALFKIGMCLEKLSERPDALATFYKIIEQERRPDRPHEFFWFYKAGFNAAQLLEEDSKWQPAAMIYQKLASAGGARSEEAKERLARLRLEHFLWEQ